MFNPVTKMIETHICVRCKILPAFFTTLNLKYIAFAWLLKSVKETEEEGITRFYGRSIRHTRLQEPVDDHCDVMSRVVRFLKQLKHV